MENIKTIRCAWCRGTGYENVSLTSMKPCQDCGGFGSINLIVPNETRVIIRENKEPYNGTVYPGNQDNIMQS